jgi:hypothetical protein
MGIGWAATVCTRPAALGGRERETASRGGKGGGMYAYYYSPPPPPPPIAVYGLSMPQLV